MTLLLRSPARMPGPAEMNSLYFASARRRGPACLLRVMPALAFCAQTGLLFTQSGFRRKRRRSGSAHSETIAVSGLSASRTSILRSSAILQFQATILMDAAPFRRLAPKRPMSVPAVGVLRKTGTLYSYDAEALAGGRLHHHPALQAIHHLGAQLPQSRHFGRDVVGFDVYMDAALMVHALDLHDWLIGRGLQHAIIAAATRMGMVHGPTQRLAPEAGGLVDIGGLAVDQHGAEAGMVHISASHASPSNSQSLEAAGRQIGTGNSETQGMMRWIRRHRLHRLISPSCAPPVSEIAGMAALAQGLLFIARGRPIGRTVGGTLHRLEGGV